jgi:hypothetical protein
MNTRTFCRLAAIAVLSTATTIFAGPLKRADLPADPAWVVHLDCDALRASAIGQALARELTRPAIDDKFSAFQAMFNFDPRSALRGVSLYGYGNKPADALLVVYANFDAARLDTLVKAAKEYQSSVHRSRTIHSWIDESKKTAEGPVQRRMFAAVAGERIVFAQREDRLASALDVIDGFAANLSTSPAFPALGSPERGGFFQAASRKLDIPTTHPNAALVRVSQEMRMELAENDGTTTANITLLAKDEEVAGHMNSIAQGLLALIKMQNDMPERQKLAESMSLSHEGPILGGTLSIPTADFLRIARAAVERQLRK